MMSSVDGDEVEAPEEELQVVSVPAPRSGHVSVALGNRVLIWGGYTSVHDDDHDFSDRYVSSDEVWIYDTEIDMWSRQRTDGNSPPGLSGSCAVMIGHKMYVVCGHCSQGNINDVYILDTRTWVWSMVPQNERWPSPRDKFAAWEYDDKLCIFAGYGLPVYFYLNDNGEYFRDPSTTMQAYSRGWNNQLLVFDPAEKSWTNPPCWGCVPSPRAAHAVAKFERQLYLFGGRHNDLRLNDLYHLDLATSTWSRIHISGALPAPRTWHVFCPIGNRHVLLHGGYSQHPPEIQTGEPLDDTWLFDTATHEWVSLPWFKGPACLWHTAVQTTEQTVVLFGGCTSNIFADQEMQRHSNRLCTFQLSPKSLLSLSLDASFEYRNLLASEWKQLPARLCHLLHARVARTHEAYCSYK